MKEFFQIVLVFSFTGVTWMGRVAIAKRIAHASHKKMVSRQPKLSLEKPVAARKPEREIIPRTVHKNIGG